MLASQKWWFFGGAEPGCYCTNVGGKGFSSNHQVGNPKVVPPGNSCQSCRPGSYFKQAERATTQPRG